MSIPPARSDWHTLSAEETLEHLRSSSDGLTAAEVIDRQASYGPNRLERVAPVPAWRILLDQFANVVVLLLLVASVLALALGDFLEAGAIAAVLAINTVIGFAVELRARRAMDALLRFEVPQARVVREGEAKVVPADQVVPGDVLQIEEGDAVPADGRLLTLAGLRVNEAPLTGESIPVEKEASPVGDPMTPMAERTSMIYSGTTVTGGRCSAVVTGTGASTEIGRIGTLIAEVEAGTTPLEARLAALGHRLVWLTLGVAALVIGLGVLRGAPIGLMIETGIALAIAAVPEGLPAVATIALAVGLRRMARRNTLVRRLAAVEALGATTVVCTDKTGTLTAGEMTVTEIATADRLLSVSGEGFSTDGEFLHSGGVVAPESEAWLSRLLEACALTHRATLGAADEAPVGDPTDAALLVLALKGGVEPERVLEDQPQVDEIPFETHTRSSASIHMREGVRTIYVKGAPATVLERCARWVARAQEQAMDEASRVAIGRQNELLAARGLRVIALASGSTDEIDSLTFLGLVGILDPPAPGVRSTIRTLRDAGIRTVVVTGDQRATGEAIARDLGALAEGEGSLDGRDLAGLSPGELAQRVDSVGVYSRVTPEDKVNIVAALQSSGEVVAMIGDGVNDAAALKKADIGVAMGRRGTDVAKQASAIVLTDDRFRTIGVAVEEGRVIYDNIRKFVFYLFSCNLAEVAVILGASLAGAPIPLLPLQILWLNLVTDTFPALALAMEPAEPGVMARPPRHPEHGILSRRFVGALGFYSLLITVSTLAAFGWGITRGAGDRATTIAFMTLALAQLFHLGNARSRGPVLEPARAFANRWALGAIPLVLGLQMLAVYWPPLSRVLQTVPLSFEEWLVIVALSSVPAAVGQLIRSGKRNGAPASP